MAADQGALGREQAPREGVHAGGELVGERDLAAAIQVSRETVRGGVQILAARGIIEVSHGARTRVVSSTSDSPPGGLKPASERQLDQVAGGTSTSGMPSSSP